MSSADQQPVIMDFTLGGIAVPFATAQPMLVSRTILINYQVLSAQPERQRVQQEEDDPQRFIPVALRIVRGYYHPHLAMFSFTFYFGTVEFHVKPVERKYEISSLSWRADECRGYLLFQLVARCEHKGAFSTSGLVGSFRRLEYRRGQGDGAV